MRMPGIDHGVWLQHAWLNHMQSLVLLAVMGGFTALLGWFLWGAAGVLWLLLLVMVLLLFGPVMVPQLIMRLYNASPLGVQVAPQLNRVVTELAHRAGLPQAPSLYYVPSRTLNAFAVGTPNQAAIALTDGLLRTLEWREIAAILAHEISHIRNNDLRVMGIADLFSRLTSVLSLFGQMLLLINLPLLLFTEASISWLVILLLIFAPSLSALAQLGLSRVREYDADLNAARLTGDPRALASALLRIEQLQGSWFERVLLPGRQVPDPSLLRTHPGTAERVRRLMQLDGGRMQPWPPLVAPGDRPHASPRQRPTHPPRWHISGLWH